VGKAWYPSVGHPRKQDEKLTGVRDNNDETTTAFHISTAKIQWTTLNLTSTTKINVLANGDYNEPVIISGPPTARSKGPPAADFRRIHFGIA
jgi:hypothetical protein